MKFLETVDTISEIRSIFKNGGPVRAAVSYWGDGALDSLCIEKGQDLYIVCDVLSGGCNPVEIRQLIKVLGKERVLTFDRLHAKVWFSDTMAIVGSSNASSNGLGFEGEEAASLTEANVAFSEAKTLDAIKKWWSGSILAGARLINNADLRRAKELRRRHRKARPLTKYPDLLTGLRAEPNAYKDRNLYVWVYKHGTFDPWVSGALEQARMNFGGNGRVECWQDVVDPPPPNSFVIDFDSESDIPTFDGMYRILDPAIHKTKKGTLLLCEPADRFEGSHLGHRATWQAAARAARDGGGGKDCWEANDFAHFIPKTNVR